MRTTSIKISCRNIKNRFATENQLVELFEAVAPILNKGFESVLEFESSNGIADIAFYKLRKDWQSNSKLGEIHPRWVYALTQLPYRKKFSTSEFAKLTGVTKQTVLNVLKSYESAGYCEKTSPSDWIKNKQPKLVANKVYAVEAKLKDWKRALKQAFRYKDYANRSWVVMDERNINPARKNLSMFQTLGVGLASISTEGQLQKLWVPEEEIPKLPVSQWYANALIARQAAVNG